MRYKCAESLPFQIVLNTQTFSWLHVTSFIALKLKPMDFLSDESFNVSLLQNFMRDFVNSRITLSKKNKPFLSVQIIISAPVGTAHVRQPAEANPMHCHSTSTMTTV